MISLDMTLDDYISMHKYSKTRIQVMTKLLSSSQIINKYIINSKEEDEQDSDLDDFDLVNSFRTSTPSEHSSNREFLIQSTPLIASSQERFQLQSQIQSDYQASRKKRD